MSTIPMKQHSARKNPEEIVKLLARKYGVSARYVNMVIEGERKNAAIFTDYMTYKQEHNLLLKAVRLAIPF